MITGWERNSCLKRYNRRGSIGPATLFFWPGRALMLGVVDDATPHAHHALQLIIGLNGPFLLETPAKNFECRSALITPNEVHRFRGLGNQHVLLLLDAQSSMAQSVQSSMGNAPLMTEFDITVLQPHIEHLANYAGKPFDCASMKTISGEMLSALWGLSSGSMPLDPRIRAALEFMNCQPELKASLGLVAQTVGLSEGRLVHLFREQVGIPIRRYLLWMRLVRSIEILFDGSSLTTAAHNSGFADSAHFARTFRRMFGLTPSGLFKNSQFVQVVACSE